MITTKTTILLATTFSALLGATPTWSSNSQRDTPANQTTHIFIASTDQQKTSTASVPSATENDSYRETVDCFYAENDHHPSCKTPAEVTTDTHGALFSDRNARIGATPGDTIDLNAFKQH